MSGSQAAQNPFRFSTKFTDEESGLVYYGYRYYSPAAGRWVSRDPIGEYGGANVYGFLHNSSLGDHDYLGLTIPGMGPGAYPPFTMPPTPGFPGLFNDGWLWAELAARWRGSTGLPFGLPDEAVSRMLERGHNRDDIEDMKRRLRLLCAANAKSFKGVLGPNVVDASFTSAGAEHEAWYLGGHERTISGKIDCCSRSGEICLEVRDVWDFDENDRASFRSDPWGL